jgi:hypothetical protein
MKYAALNSTNSAHERDEKNINWSDGKTGFGRSRHKGNITLRQILKKGIGVNDAFARAEY